MSEQEGHHLSIQQENVGEFTIIHLFGRLDTVTAPVGETNILEIMDKTAGAVLIDMEKIDYMSSSGLRMLLFISSKKNREKKSLVIANLQKNVMMVIKISGTDRILFLAETLEDGMTILSKK